MGNLKFYIVDVFAEQKYAGNQLAVIRGAEGLSTDEMQTLALEMYYSETTFIPTDGMRDGGFDVRIFTSDTEMPFAGHPTLGTAFVVNQFILPEPAKKVILNEKVGPIPVTFGDDGVLWMRQNPPTFGETFDHAEIASIIGLAPEQLDSRFPVQIVSTGIPFTIVPLTTLYAAQHIKIDWDRFNALMNPHVIGSALNGILVFSPEPYEAENDLNARVLFDTPTMPEDPATGAAQGPLASYLSKHHYFGTDAVDCRVEQGYEMRRPSLIMLKAHDKGEHIEVNVGGRVQMVAEGELIR
ncbi:MAG: PhzF family phenazine biosynthesis protein [Aggregatilineales bacterium]